MNQHDILKELAGEKDLTIREINARTDGNKYLTCTRKKVDALCKFGIARVRQVTSKSGLPKKLYSFPVI